MNFSGLPRLFRRQYNKNTYFSVYLSHHKDETSELKYFILLCLLFVSRNFHNQNISSGILQSTHKNLRLILFYRFVFKDARKLRMFVWQLCKDSLIIQLH